MAKIQSIQHSEIKLKPDGSQYLLVNVLLDDGEEAQVIVGGQVEVYLHNGQIRAFVKKLDKQAGV